MLFIGNIMQIKGFYDTIFLGLFGEKEAVCDGKKKYEKYWCKSVIVGFWVYAVSNV